MERYIVITLGPIFDTINLASSPAALWTGSYLFSYMNKTICEFLVAAGVKEEDILTPYYTTGADLPKKCDGVGLYHDRIVFRADGFSIQGFPAIREKAIEKLAKTFCVDKAYLEEYLLIAAAEDMVENPILDTSKLLDCMELAKPIVSGREDNPLLSMLVGEKFYGNEVIKNLPLTCQFDSWQLRKPNGQLKSIGDICGADWKTGMKKHAYYAIVRADGDRVGEVIKTLKSVRGPETEPSVRTVREFSEDCISYCAEVAEKVAQYGGVAIYSGGDDLLAIMPCENRDGKTVFDFIQEANGLFTSRLSKEKYGVDVSLSFGVTICFHKFPLYEALADSQYMLFGLAKSYRNCTAIHLQKHAGQSEGLVIPNGAMETFKARLQDMVSNQDGEWFQSVHHKLKQFRHLFLLAGDNRDRVFHLFENIFDAASHSDNDVLHKVLPQFYLDIRTSLGITSVVDCEDAEAAEKKLRAANTENDPIDTLCYILRLYKFFVEKGGQEND